MEQLNRFGKMRLEYLHSTKPAQLDAMRRSGGLEKHLLSLQRSALWDWDQMVSAGLREEQAEQYVLREHILV